jgi:hypothetical protein
MEDSSASDPSLRGASLSRGDNWDHRAPEASIYFNVVHTVDGAWNLDGQAMSNEELGQAIALG